MKVKKYIANSEKEAIQKIKDELGRDVIILNSRKVRGKGLWRFLGKKRTEVTVAVDEESKEKESQKNYAGSLVSQKINFGHTEKDRESFSGENSGERQNQRGMADKNQEVSERKKLLEAIENARKDIDKRDHLKEERAKSNNQRRSNESIEKELSTDNFATQILEKELNEDNKEEDNKEEDNKEADKMVVTSEIEELKLELSQTKNMMESLFSEIKKSNHQESKENTIELPEVSKEYYDILVEAGVEEDLVKKLIKNSIEKTSSKGQSDKYNFYQTLISEIQNNLYYPVNIDYNIYPEIYTLVGPTGVGKTTTVAKLAARYTLLEKKKVGLITIDTYRIAAVEQLKTYGDILSLPVEVVMTVQEFKNAIEKFNDKDVILVDTAGRSHKNEEQMAELKEFLEARDLSCNYLVLSLGTRYKDLQKIIDKYKNIKIDGYIFTKADETESLGNILNIVSKTQRGFDYVTVGQDVPDDIKKADIDKISKELLGD